MKNTVSKAVLAIFLLATAVFSYAAKPLIPLSKQPLASTKIDLALEKIIQESPNGVSVKIFKERSFYLQRFDTEVIAGEIFGGTVGHPNDCFVYIKSKRKEEKIFKMSQKSDQLWHCAGEPVFEAKSIRERDDLLILGMYLFQAPSGDSFYLPQVIQVTKDGKAHTGDIDHCVDNKTDEEAVSSMNELSKIAAKCIFELGKLEKTTTK
ncbi:hypothetical protein RY831_32550 [Noviherbaspirillum sp. CPCC 100848]|uniref:Methanolan biosynthesis EpsI domain-containing protein n=1 Tax=Noviherbaspirillum album TaxID=3080276 RepID=A0ABU6JJK0_9BURK|nr:hypothetical protein [Noviherbaspirillum sp. CPCC 100848]MEC4723841.1 hypothetical protein [Noviherbaspirillum sp. CPCC 100848]